MQLKTASYSATSIHLALAAARPMVQRHQDADHAVQRRQRVADAHADAHRHAAGFAGEVAQAAHRLADHAEAGPVAVRARSGRSR